MGQNIINNLNCNYIKIMMKKNKMNLVKTDSAKVIKDLEITDRYLV